MKKQLINSIIFLFIIFIVSCDNNENKDIKIDSHYYDDDPEFELLWERYLESSGGGWKDNLNGRFSWDDSYALEGLLYAFQTDQKLINDPPWFDGEVIYFDGHHLNEVGAVKYAMHALPTIKESLNID